MDKANIELYAVNAVKESILDTDILHPSIKDNDKEPSWDGHIYVYKSSLKTKNNLDGTVAVQVKGTGGNDLSPKTISHSAEVADLKNYLHNGGVIYFVVRIHKADSNKRKIYYETLTPVKLKNYLQGAEEQKTKTIELKEFPCDKNEKTAIVVNFFNNSRRQTSFVKSGFISLEELHKNTSPLNCINYTIPIVGYGRSDCNALFSSILGKESYIYVKCEGSNALIPTDEPVTIQEVRHKINEGVFVRDKCYYDHCERIHSLEGGSIKIGDSTVWKFGKPDNPTVKVSISFPSSLRKTVKDMQFVIDALTNKRFSIGTAEFGLGSIDENAPDFILATQNELLFYRRIDNMLNILNVKEDLNLDELLDIQIRDIETLVKAFIDKNDIHNITLETSISVLDLKISNIALKLIINKNDNGTHSIHDFFNSEFDIFYKDKNGAFQIISPYSALSKDDYLVVSNIDYNQIPDSYKKVAKQNPNIFEIASMDMLNMLLAYDQNSKVELLEAAKGIADWIITDAENIGKNISTLNYLQIVKRERPFIKGEIKQLCEISEDIGASEQEKIGAHLLLDNYVFAEIHFDKLTDTEQEVFKTFPIYKFWSRL